MFDKDGWIDKLTDYIEKNLKKGYTKDSLRWALVNQGYSRIEVDKALKRVDLKMAEKAPILKVKPEITHKFAEPKKKRWRFF